MSEFYHKGRTITLQSDGTFSCEELNLSATSLAAMKKKIDGTKAEGNDLGRVKVMYKRYSDWREAIIAEATSIVNRESWRGKQVRVTVRGTSETASLHAIYPVNEEGAKAMADFEAKQTAEKKAFDKAQTEAYEAELNRLGLKPFESFDALKAYAADAAGDKQEG